MRKNNKITEQDIIYKYLNKLNFNKSETFNFNNDAAFLKKRKNKEIVVTNDTIVESIDFFQSDPAESVAQKIITYNLSDISSMGAYPYAYTLSLCILKKINYIWLKRFTKKLFLLQKKYKFFLIGGDLSQSKNIIISSCFFGFTPKIKILKRSGARINDDIWVTGNIGDSYIGLKIRENKISLNNLDKKYFLNKYLYPSHCFIGEKLSKYASSAIDISDGFYGDLNNLLISKNIGANIKSILIPFSIKAKKIIKFNRVNFNSILSSGDDYQLIFTANPKNSPLIKKLCKKNNIKVTKVGNIIGKKGLFLDNMKLNIVNNSFQHFA